MNEFILVMSIHFIALLTPGADFIYLTNTALSNGTRLAIASSLGIALSNGFYILLCLLGYAVLFSESIFVMNFIRFFGGVYLVYLSLLIYKSKIQNFKAKQKVQTTFSKEVFKGFLVSFLNPKISIFYISLFTLVISKDTPLSTQLFYGLWMFLLVFLWDSLIAILLNNKMLKNLILNISKLNTIFAFVLFFMGLALIYSLFDSMFL